MHTSLPFSSFANVESPLGNPSILAAFLGSKTPEGFKILQPSKFPVPKETLVVLIVTLSNTYANSNACIPTVLTDAPIVRDVYFIEPRKPRYVGGGEKASLPILTTSSGMIKDNGNAKTLLKALFPITFADGKSKCGNVVHPSKALSPITIADVKLKFVNVEHLSKALFPIEVTARDSTDFSLEQR
jgi:hypothetical protein